MKVDKLPLAEKAFDPARALQDGRKEPFLYLFSEAAKSLLARKVALDELPELAAASFHAYDFLTQWRFGLGSNEEIPLRDRFQALQKAASAMGDRNAAQVFADLLALDPYVLEGCLIESELCVKLNLPQLKEIDHENPVLTEVISLFGRSSDFPERLDGYLGENMPIELLSYEGWRKRIGEIVCQIDDYYVRPHRPHDILEVNFDLCETIGARVVGTGRIVFDWDMHKY